MKYKLTNLDFNSCGYCETCKIIERSYQQGRADVIDEFAKLLKGKPYWDDVHYFQSIPIYFIDEVAEQLKENKNE